MEQEIKQIDRGWLEGAAKTITFIVTKDCQLACKYCYLVGKNENERMSIETAKAAVDYILDTRDFFNEESVIWEFIGGEPFLEIDLIDNICDYIKTQMFVKNHHWFNSYRFNFATNGINYNSSKVQNFIKKNWTHLSIGITIDGTKIKHDLNRVYKNSEKGSYDDVVLNIPLWLNQFPTSGTKVTISSPDIPYMKTMTILIVDDHPIVLKGIHALLASSFAEARIVDAAGLEEAEQMLNRHKVDILITDLDLNGESGSMLIEHVRDVQPATQVVVYTMHEEPWSVGEIADMDTEAVVMKSDNAAELLMAVKSLCAGKGYYSPTFFRLLNSLRRHPDRLSDREKQVVSLTAMGLSAADMALRLGISANTVEFHRRRIMQKLKVANAAEMISRATELGFKANI